MKLIISILLFCIPIFGWGTKIEFTNVTQEIIPTHKASSKKSYYKLTAQHHIEKFSKNDTKIFLLNRKKYMLKNNYYLEGKLKTEKILLTYKKAYILGGKVYLFNVTGKINNSQVKAKEIVYDGYKSYLLKKCEIRTTSKIYRRHKFTIKVK